LILALIYGNELPQHPQQCGIIDPYCDVAQIVQGELFFFSFIVFEFMCKIIKVQQSKGRRKITHKNMFYL